MIYFLFIHYGAIVQLDAAIVANRLGRSQRSRRLQFDLRIEKIEMGNVLVRGFMILLSVWSLLSGCADTKQASDSDSSSVLSKQENDHEVHGEVGAMYGHTAR